MNSISSDKQLKRAKNIAFYALKMRPHSIFEVRQKLAKKQIAQDIIDQAVDELCDLSFLDDAQFARSWIRYRLSKPWGFRRIALELKQKGIDKTIIEEACEDMQADYEQRSIVQELADRRLKQYTHLEPMKARQRLFGYLSRRGFDISMIQQVLKDYDWK